MQSAVTGQASTGTWHIPGIEQQVYSNTVAAVLLAVHQVPGQLRTPGVSCERWHTWMGTSSVIRSDHRFPLDLDVPADRCLICVRSDDYVAHVSG